MIPRDDGRNEEYESAEPMAKQVVDMDSVSDLLVNIDFPISREQLLEQCGYSEIQWTQNETIELEDIIRTLHQEEFNSVEDLTNAMTGVLRMAFRDQSVGNQEMIISERNSST